MKERDVRGEGERETRKHIHAHARQLRHGSHARARVHALHKPMRARGFLQTGRTTYLQTVSTQMIFIILYIHTYIHTCI